jgi:hypothetical protein
MLAQGNKILNPHEDDKVFLGIDLLGSRSGAETSKNNSA